MADSAEPIIRSRIQPVVLDEGRGMTEGCLRPETPFLIVVMALGAAYLLPDCKRFRVGLREPGKSPHTCAGCQHCTHDQQ